MTSTPQAGASETPRTDEYMKSYAIFANWRWHDFARTLETENGELRARLEAAEKSRDEWVNQAEIHALDKQALKAELSAAKQGAYERAAKVCDAMTSRDKDWDTSYWNQAVERCAAAIRALSNSGERGA